ncbi:uncharacterized protein LOC141642488 [Silene latifolia]|uniref:uncharacterized protein LOC141642488 n=1 Tax=Silene latifolia TaxID=37657 RepID=UPI003D77E64C
MSSSRYNSFISKSSTSSSTELKRPKAGTKSNDSAIIKVKHEHNFAAMVKKFMDKRSTSKKPNVMPLPSNFIAEEVKKGSKIKKLFGKGSEKSSLSSSSSEVMKTKAKALTEVKANTRTLAMVLRSERELLNLNKQQQSDIDRLNALLLDRTTQVDKLKDMCLKQREEIKALKSAILFPDDMNSQLQELLDHQGSEIKQAKRVIPTLQKQISSLTGQLQCLSEDLAEVKAANYSRKTDNSVNTMKSLVYDEEEAANSLDFSSDDLVPDSPDNMLLKDVNPCLTPCYSRMKSKDYETVRYNHEGNAAARKISTSSDNFTISSPETGTFCMSDGSKYRYPRPIDRRLL